MIAVQRAVFSPYTHREITLFPSTVGEGCRALAYDNERCEVGWVPNLRHRTCYENTICSVTQSCFILLKVNKQFQGFIAKATTAQ